MRDTWRTDAGKVSEMLIAVCPELISVLVKPNVKGGWKIASVLRASDLISIQ